MPIIDIDAHYQHKRILAFVATNLTLAASRAVVSALKLVVHVRSFDACAAGGPSDIEDRIAMQCACWADNDRALNRVHSRLAALVLCVASMFSGTTVARADALASAVYVRTDTDHTLVVSPRARASTRLGERTDVDVSYAADVWTSASVDIRASASKPVTEQRNELDFGMAHELDDVTLSGSYRYSSENDYESHGLSGGGAFNFADKNSTLALNAYLFQDTVGRSGDPTFSHALSTLGGRLSFTQVFDPNMLGQITYELVHLGGYQASAYRFVGIGGTGFGCEAAIWCLPEHEPSLRTRHAIAALLRRALGDHVSLGANYRFFTDDWGLTSHTVAAQLGIMLGTDSSLTFRYRFYVQSGVSFYAAIYQTLPSASTYTTRDREQSPMQDHRLGVDLQHKLPLGDGRMRLVISTGVGGDFYTYDNFVGLRQTSALELTLALALER